MAKKKPTKKKQPRKTAADCPMCVLHAQNRSRFYDETPRVGKFVNGVCDKCGQRERGK